MEAIKENNSTLMFAERKQQTIWNPEFSVYLEKQTFVCEIKT